MAQRTKYRIIKSFDQLKKVVEYCKQTGVASIDFETKATGPRGPSISKNDKNPTGPAHKEDEPTVLGITYQIGSGYLLPLFHKDSPFSRNEALSMVQYVGRHVCENINITKFCWNLKFEYKWFHRYGSTMRGFLNDGMLLKYMLEETPPSDLKSIVARYFPEFANYEDEVNKLKSKYGGWEHIPIKNLAPYCITDCDLTLRLSLFLERKVIAKGFYSLYRNMCMMQTRVLAESEMMGLPIDTEYLDSIIKTQGAKIRTNLRKLTHHQKIRLFQKWRIEQHTRKLIVDCQAEIKELRADKTRDTSRMIKNREEKISRYIAGELRTKKEVVGDVNFNSQPQLVNLLFYSPGGFNFKVVKYTKDKYTKQPTENPSTDEEALLVYKRKDKSGFIEALLSHREMSKLYSTYMVGIKHQVSSKKTLHGSFLIHGTVTGRLSSKAPNLQNIPRDTTSSLIKTMFITPPGHVLLEVDYGQAELRVVAELANDKAMIEIFAKNYNIHVATAAKINGKFHEYEKIKAIIADPKHPDSLYWEKQKKRGKVLNFSILYLQSDAMTADQMGVSEKEAAKFKAAWFEQFPAIKEWMSDQEEFVRMNGYVMNMFGRKRRLPDIWDPKKGTQNKAIRDAINAPIQGTSSDFTQFASVILREKRIRGDIKWTDDQRYIYQAYTVHDSLGFFVQPQYLQTCIPIISDVCSNPDTLKYFGFEMKKVKMKVSPEVGKTWGGLQEYNPKVDYSKI